MSQLSEKYALILGAAGPGNMGQVITERFASEGAKVMVSGRNEEELSSFSERINGTYAVCDITKKADIDNMIDKAMVDFGRLDIAINATGWGLMAPFTETTEEDLEKMLAVQFKGPYQYFQSVVKAMSETGGSIIQISSATALIMLENHAPYMGTKAGIDHVIRCIANEFGGQGIRANSISPGLTNTPMTVGAMGTPGLLQAFEKEYPLGRIGTSEDIAAAAVFVASDECFMTGQNFQVNGGLTLRRNPTGLEVGESVKRAIAQDS
jgi:NAD(P)-dependent dehydrogenase (short-subunit alcohol dehydrogenase family)